MPPIVLSRPRWRSVHGWTVATLAAVGLSATSCRLDPVAPLARVDLHPAIAPGTVALPAATDGGEHRSNPPESQVPVVGRLRGERRHDTLVLTAQLRPRDPHLQPFYDPSRVGGWELQVFLDTDPANPGYWLGYDYIVRGGEWDRVANTLVTRRITLDDTTPGGWGPASGATTLSIRGSELQITIPLAAVGEPDGRVNVAVETYAVVPCDACDGSLTDWFVDDTFGTIGLPGRHDVMDATPVASSLAPVRGHTAAADRRLLTSAAR